MWIGNSSFIRKYVNQLTIWTEKTSEEFEWEKSTQGYLLSSFFYGYICTQIVGGVLSDKFGGKSSLLFGIFILSSSSLSTPFLARRDVRYVMALRVIQGKGTSINDVSEEEGEG